MKNIYIYNLINYSSPEKAFLAIIFKAITIFTIFYATFFVFNILKVKPIVESNLFWQSVSSFIFLLFIGTGSNINSIRYYNQVFIKRKILKIYVSAQIFFSYSFTSGIAILLGIAFAYNYSWYNQLLVLFLCFELTSIMIFFKKIKKNYFNVIIFSSLLILSFFKNLINLLFSNILFVILISIVLVPVFLSIINKILYSEKKVNLWLTFENTLLKRKSVLKLVIFEFLFLFRKKKKYLFYSILIALLYYLTLIFFRYKWPMAYIGANASVKSFISTGFSIITGIYIILCGPFLFSWSLFYLNELLLKGISIKKILVSKLLFLCFSVFILYVITFPLILYLNMFPIVFTIATIFNLFILSILTLAISSLNLAKVDININPAKYKESGVAQAIIILILQKAFMLLYTLLATVLSNIEILFLISSLSFLTFLFYPLIINKLETAIIKRRSAYDTKK